MEVQIPHGKGQFWWIGGIVKYSHFLPCLCKNGRTDDTDPLAVWVVDSSGLKDAQVKSYSSGGANVPPWKDTLPPHGECAIEPSVYGVDSLCQITLITCYLWARPLTHSDR